MTMLQSSKHILGLIVIIGFLSYIGLHIFYYEHTSPTELATKLIEEDKDANNCFLLRTFDIGPRPTTYELQMRCVYKYASLTKDPSACELLLPSSYGWSCLGAAKEKGPSCYINYNKDVEWWTYEPDRKSFKATIEECKQGSIDSGKGKKCCHILLLTSEEDINDCSRFKGDDPFNDLCLSQLAVKLKDSSICNGIVNDNAREICKISVKYK